MRRLSFLDRCIAQLDQQFGNKNHKNIAARKNPGDIHSEATLSPEEIKHVIGLMRVNHAGEIAAQGLYQGQALTAKFKDTQHHMEKAAQEEVDHLAWCYARLEELGGRASYLDPLWYTGALCIGALAGAAGDTWSLGFIAETERQVSAHLDTHLSRLPKQDRKSAAILTQMQEDEERHEKEALEAGGKKLPLPLRLLMKVTSIVMVKTAYHL